MSWGDQFYLSTEVDSIIYYAYVDASQTVTFSSSSKTRFKMISPLASVNLNDCVYNDDKFYLGVDSTRLLEIDSSSSSMKLKSNGAYGTLHSFRSLDRSRSILFGDHVTLDNGENSLFVSESELTLK
eukprot:Awhi_evm1s12474